MNAKELQIACFMVSGETFGVDIMQIREIIRFRKVTKVPRAPDFIEGIINLRGEPLPVVDLRKRLSFDSISPTRETRIIVIKSDGRDVGMIVDSVTKVLNVKEGGVNPPPQIIKGIEGEYLKGVVWDSSDAVMVFDIDKILSAGEKTGLNSMDYEEA